MAKTKGVADTEQKQGRDRQRAPTVCRCSICGGEIYEGQLYYEVEGKRLCYDCLPSFARHYFLYGLTTAQKRGRRK